MELAKRVLVVGGEGVLEKALNRLLSAQGFHPLKTDGVDFSHASQVNAFFLLHRPQLVFLQGGKTRGISGNLADPVGLARENLLVATHVLEAAHRYGVDKLLYIASSCIYPSQAPQPLKIESLLSGPLEVSSEAYALAKLTAMKLCLAYRRQFRTPFIAAIATNTYGPEDDFQREAHLIPSLFFRVNQAIQENQPVLSIWGTGTPRREFLYVDDLASACLLAMEKFDAEYPLNLAGGETLSVAEVARSIAGVLDYSGALAFDVSKPDGTAHKSLDASELRSLGWAPRTDFQTGLQRTREGFLGERTHLPVSLPYPSGRGANCSDLPER